MQLILAARADCIPLLLDRFGTSYDNATAQKVAWTDKKDRNVMKVLWIVGLGNPGKQYEQTRHNIGFQVVDRLADRLNIRLSNQRKCKAEIGEGAFENGVKVVLHKPMTYMNLSGESVRAYFEYFRPDLDQLLVIYDDLDTEIGKVRLRYKGSAGGHNGVKSIIQHLGTEQFKRIRVGISRPPAGMEVVRYVLDPFTKEEQARMEHVIDHCCDALAYLSEHSFDQTMAKFNGEAKTL